MPYLLDTNAWIGLLKQRNLLLGRRFAVTERSQIYSCAPVRAELMHGARKYELPAERRRKVELLLGGFTSLPFDDACADQYGAIRDDLEARSCVIGQMDMQIAAVALVHNLVLVTGNKDEFGRVHGLKIEDWSSAP